MKIEKPKIIVLVSADEEWKIIKKTIELAAPIPNG
jgi:hypothetical protein